MPESVTFESDGRIGRITIRRPRAKNALNWEAMQAFAECVEAAHRVDDLRAVVLAGEGDAFCSGGDLRELDSYPSRSDGARLAAGMSAALDRLAFLPVPTLAAIEGPALGGGAEIALACDLRVMAEGAALGMMHIRLGITPAWGGGQRLLQQVGYARTLEWLSAGRVFGAEEALQVGLVSRTTSRGRANEEALALAASIAVHDAAAVRAVKRIARAGLEHPLPAALEKERAEFPDLWAAPAHLEASRAFVARSNHRKRAVDVPAG